MPGDRKCIVPKCGRTKFNNPDMQFYAFPKDPKYELKWMENIKIKRFLNKLNFVCSIHFEEKMKCEARLKKNAVPTLYLGYDGPVPHETFEDHSRTYKRKCCVESCKIKNLYENRILYKFPDNVDEKYAWAIACNLPLPLQNKKFYICERHFEKVYLSRMRLCAGAFPKFYLSGDEDEDIEQSDEIPSSSGAEQSDEEELSPHQKRIQKLNAEKERLRKRILYLENNAIYPQPGSSAESLIFARMIVGSKNTDYTEKERALAKKLRCNISSIAYRFMNHELGCRLPLFKPAEIIRFKLKGYDRK